MLTPGSINITGATLTAAGGPRGLGMNTTGGQYNVAVLNHGGDGSAGRTTTSTPSIASSCAPASTASVRDCTVGVGEWWTTSSLGMGPR